MMLDPMSYYEMNIRGKSEEEILAEIEQMKEEMKALRRQKARNKMLMELAEDERFGNMTLDEILLHLLIKPSVETVMHYKKEYLKMAQNALEQMKKPKYLEMDEEERERYYQMAVADWEADGKRMPISFYLGKYADMTDRDGNVLIL